MPELCTWAGYVVDRAPGAPRCYAPPIARDRWGARVGRPVTALHTSEQRCHAKQTSAV